MTGLRDPEVYIPKFLKIRTKEGKITALRPKPAQQMLLDAVKREREAGTTPYPDPQGPAAGTLHHHRGDDVSGQRHPKAGADPDRGPPG